MFSFCERKIVADEPIFEDVKPVIEGAEIFDIVAPIVKLTGKRENPFKLLTTLANNPEKQRALSVVMQELPTLVSDPRLTDDDRVELLRPRLMVGTPSDDDNFMRYLEGLAKPLFDSVRASMGIDSSSSSDVVSNDSVTTSSNVQTE